LISFGVKREIILMDSPPPALTNELGKRAAKHVVDAADRLFHAQGGEPCAPVRDLLTDSDIDAAYAAQDINTERALAAGRRLIGRKIGLTSLAVQRQLGVGQPDFGMLFADMAMGEGMPIASGRLMQPKIEAEIALVLQHGLDTPQATIADVIQATAYALPALEIVGSRIAKWDIRITDTIADNASSGLFILGGPARPLSGLDLGAGAVMRMRRGDEVVSQGSGSDCFGHPLNAAAWLAGEMARRGRPLQAGDIVLTGALGPMVPVNPGDRFDAEMAGLGSVCAIFEGLA
jgi:2-keto-4-pentenoate hydratase